MNGLFYFFFNRYVCVYMRMCARKHTICVGTLIGWKRVLDLLELEFQVVVSCATWVLGTKLRSPGRTEVLLSSGPCHQPRSKWSKSTINVELHLKRACEFSIYCSLHFLLCLLI